MSRLPDSTENNRERITEQEDREIASGLAADQRARFGEPVPTTNNIGMAAIRDVLQKRIGKLHPLFCFTVTTYAMLEICKDCYEQGMAEKQREWDAWIERHQAEADPIADEVLNGSSWRRRHE